MTPEARLIYYETTDTNVLQLRQGTGPWRTVPIMQFEGKVESSMKNGWWIALGMLAFALLFAGIVVVAAKSGATFTEVSGK